MRCLAEREGRLGVACVLLKDMLDDFLVIVFATGQVFRTYRWQKPRGRKRYPCEGK